MKIPTSFGCSSSGSSIGSRELSLSFNHSLWLHLPSYYNYSRFTTSGNLRKNYIHVACSTSTADTLWACWCCRFFKSRLDDDDSTRESIQFCSPPSPPAILLLFNYNREIERERFSQPELHSNHCTTFYAICVAPYIYFRIVQCSVCSPQRAQEQKWVCMWKSVFVCMYV